MKKRLLSLALALVMVFSLLPINAFAIGDTTILSQPDQRHGPGRRDCRIFGFGCKYRSSYGDTVLHMV